jgi:hypothetical protein
MSKRDLWRMSCAVVLALCASPTYAQHTAADLTARYYDTKRDCGSSTRPAFLCSGVLIRGTRYSTAYHSWDPSPTSLKDGGISFSYLRKDSKFDKLAFGYNNGVIFYPIFGAPKGKMDPEYICAFPLDGGDPYTQPCQSWGVLTGAEWYTGFTNGAFKGSGFLACGFTVDDHKNPKGGTANGFSAVIDAMKLLGQKSFTDQNEIRANTWTAGQGKVLPIEAFFYIKDGLPNARNDQIDFQRTTGLWVPVIRLTLPATMNDEAKFNYIDADQAMPPPE